MVHRAQRAPCDASPDGADPPVGRLRSGTTDFEDYAGRTRHAAHLVERGEYDAAVEVLEDLLASDISDVDKAMMCLNLAAVLDKLGRVDEALVWYGTGADYEARHGRFFVAELRAAYLAEKRRDAESLVLYEELLTRPSATEDDKERFRHNIELLRQRTSR